MTERWRWDPTISLGAVLQLGGVIVAALGLWTYGIQFQRDTENAIISIDRDRNKYIPIVETLKENDRVQDLQLQQMNSLISEIRSAQTATTQVLQALTGELTKISVSIARVEERLPAKTENP